MNKMKLHINTPCTGTLLFIVSVFLFFHNNIALAQNRSARIDQLLQQYHDSGQFDGAVLVAENGKVIYKNGFGYANMDWEIPNKPDTKFRIGSITKQFVAMLIMQLVEDGKIKLDGKIIDYIPEYRNETGNKITIFHLLTHTSGIPSYTSIPGFWSDSTRNPYEIENMIRNFHSGDLEFEPGSSYSYNNTGYFLLAVIIEKVTGKSFEENLHEKVLGPVQMNNSGVVRNEKIIKNKANGYVNFDTTYVNERFFHMANILGAGDMYSTVEDLYLWDQALYTDKLLSEDYKEIMFTPVINDYAFGWDISKIALGESSDSIDVISHSGGILAFNTIIFRLIKENHLIVLLNNIRYAYGNNDLNRICGSIANILYDYPY